jgi:hypothetical protein
MDFKFFVSNLQSSTKPSGLIEIERSLDAALYEGLTNEIEITASPPNYKTLNQFPAGDVSPQVYLIH